MSISTSNNQNKRSVTTKDIVSSSNTIKRTFGAIANFVPKNTLDFIVILSFTTTAMGELFGRCYGIKWYILLLFLLIAFLTKETIKYKYDDININCNK